MMLMNIWVKDKSNGHIHQVGTDVHDSLELFGDKVEYYNLQNGCGTLSGDVYEFVEAPDLDDYIGATPNELLINRKLLHGKVLRKIKRRKFFEKLKALWRDEADE